ncbi:hypothetical protein VN1239_08380 [Helicobacter pylori]|nr:hypothetical protein KVL12_03885 [Helicobacter pylori]GHQ89285.1 hypothetical protein VN1239_08380 [Helicobacter pylori]
MQMLFDKINNGSPFGVIREVFSFSPQLRQFLNNKCLESLFFVYENEPSTTFNLKNFLLVLAKYIYSEKICYCENKQDKNTHNMKSIEFLSTGRHDFGKDLDPIDVELSNPIFDVSNKFLSGKSRLTIEVPRVKLENIKLPDMKEIYVNQWYINIFINTFIFSINEGFYILTGV